MYFDPGDPRAPRPGGVNDVDDNAMQAVTVWEEEEIMNVVDPEWSVVLDGWRREVHRCKLCSTLFREMENMGRWLCRYHVGEFVAHNRDEREAYGTEGYWTCCLRRGDSSGYGRKGFLMRGARVAKGCVRTDHTPHDTPYTEEDDQIVPLAVATKYNLGTNPKADLMAGDGMRYDALDIVGHLATDMTDYDAQQDHFVFIRRFDSKHRDKVMKMKRTREALVQPQPPSLVQWNRVLDAGSDYNINKAYRDALHARYALEAPVL